MKLYDLERSGNCYKIRLFLSILDIGYQKIPVDVKGGELASKEFLAMNPHGLVPVLVDGEITIYDSAAILTYLARKYATEDWLPCSPIGLARVIQWLTFEQNEIRYGLARARTKLMKIQTPFANSGTLEECQALGTGALQIMEKQLANSDWLAGESHASICDIACYPYTALCGEGGISLAPYTAVNRWLERIEKLDGYIELPHSN